MKKLLLCLLLCCALPLTCLAETPAVMIQLHDGTDFGNRFLSQHSGRHVYDYIADEGVGCMEYRIYELIDGEWQTAGPGKMLLETRTGTFGFGFDAMMGTFTSAIHWNGEGMTSTSSTRHRVEEPLMVNELTSAQYGPLEMPMDEERPIAVQLISESNTELTGYMLEEMVDPEVVNTLEWDRAFMLTVAFTESIE